MIEKRSADMDIFLPSPKAPIPNYLSTKQAGNMLYVSGKKSELTDAVGKGVAEEQEKKAAKDTTTLMLAVTKKNPGICI